MAKKDYKIITVGVSSPNITVKFTPLEAAQHQVSIYRPGNLAIPAISTAIACPTANRQYSYTFNVGTIHCTELKIKIVSQKSNDYDELKVVHTGMGAGITNSSGNWRTVTESEYQKALISDFTVNYVLGMLSMTASIFISKGASYISLAAASIGFIYNSRDSAELSIPDLKPGFKFYWEYNVKVNGAYQAILHYRTPKTNMGTDFNPESTYTINSRYPTF